MCCKYEKNAPACAVFVSSSSGTQVESLRSINARPGDRLAHPYSFIN